MDQKGRPWMTLGLLLLLAALCLTGYNVAAEQHAERESQTLLTELLPAIPADPVPVPTEVGPETEYPDYMLNRNMDMPVDCIDGHPCVGAIRIPALNLSLPVLSQWSYPNLKVGPCLYSGTAYQGNMVLCAHNYRTHFGSIRRLSIGDDVFFQDVDGNLFHYQVADLETLAPTAVEAMRNSEWSLTLFTCTLGGATRMTVRCQQTEAPLPLS